MQTEKCRQSSPKVKLRSNKFSFWLGMHTHTLLPALPWAMYTSNVQDPHHQCLNKCQHNSCTTKTYYLQGFLSALRGSSGQALLCLYCFVWYGYIVTHTLYAAAEYAHYPNQNSASPFPVAANRVNK